MRAKIWLDDMTTICQLLADWQQFLISDKELLERLRLIFYLYDSNQED